VAYTTIDDPALFFNTVTYSGNGSARTITGVGFDPNLVWIKNRSGDFSHFLGDSIRGSNKNLNSNATAAEEDNSAKFQSVTTDGFQIGTHNGANKSGDSIVAWCWKESSSSGFDMVGYAGDGVAGRNISHSLGAKPHWMLVKNRSAEVKWAVYHEKNTSAPGTDHLQLNDTAGTSDDDSTWDDTEPTSSVFRVKSSTSTNGSSANYIAYLWTPIQGFSKFGSYTGNGTDGNGPFIFTGFKPAFFIVKKTSESGNNWVMLDNKRSDVSNANVNDQVLYANGSGAESSSSIRSVDMVSNGIKLRGNDGDINNNNQTYIYAAFAESPFVNSNGVPNNAK
tara:strand:+ start:1404 stop:2411 length:1008 start_codon:yes stop_codon:yes gene_type:complete